MARYRRAWPGVMVLIATAAACGARTSIDMDEPSSAPSGTPSDTTSGTTSSSSSGVSPECVTVADCVPEATACRTPAACDQGACVFDTLMEIPCETGLPGHCAKGMRACSPDGKPSEVCLGPSQPEQCDADLVDEDCDGLVNEEGEHCVCGDGFVSPGAGEECDDGGTKDGDRCSAACLQERVVQLAAGGSHTCALLTGGIVKCWGANDFGQLGLGDKNARGDKPNEMGAKLPAVSLGAGRTAVSLAAGIFHTCALLDDGSVKCWGANMNSQLGLGDEVQRGDQPNEMGDNLPAVNLGAGVKAVAIESGGGHTCARLGDGSVKCWGFNLEGQLGLGDKNVRGNKPNQMGDSLKALNLGAGRTAVSLAAGSVHTCAVLDNDTVKCWGGNDWGQLGLEDKKDRGDEPKEMGDNLPWLGLGSGRVATALTADYQHTCALLDDGSVKCWGANDWGQLGLGDVASRGDGPKEMGDKLPAVNLGTGRTAVSLAAGAERTCAVLDDGSVKCWGHNFLGSLGLGDVSDRGDQPEEMGDSLKAVSLGAGRTAVSLVTGIYHTCAVLDDGSAKCWGSNKDAELGQGDTASRGDDPGEMGDNLQRVKLFSDIW